MLRRFLPATVVVALVLASCGDDSTPSDASSGAPSTCPDVTQDTVPVASFSGDKPAVDIPDATPTELVITDLVEGTGPAAAAGDVVEVNYVGVRTEDGTEFDNSYDDGRPFPVTLGQGDVIAGWDQGLIGIKTGGRRQLDIPADLAYGDNPNGDIIQPGDALTFVVEAMSVTPGPPAADPADKPTVEIPTSSGATELVVTDLVEGDSCRVAAAGQTIFMQATLYRGDTGEELQSSWDTGRAVQIALEEPTIQGLIDGVVGMGVGGRRLLVLPPDMGFGADGNTQMGLEADTDLIVVVDLVDIT